MFGGTEKKSLTVEGMTCGHCEQRVEKAVGQIDGVKKVKASHTDQTVEIAYKKGTPISDTDIEKAIAELGFKVEAL